MNTHILRQYLHNYIDSLNDEKLDQLYLSLEEEMSRDPNFTLSDDDIAYLDKRRKDHINGVSESYTWEEVREMVIRNQKARRNGEEWK